MNSMGFDKPEAKTRVVVAMSGGVDSSVVGCLLHEQGYDVVGVTLQLYDHGAAVARKGACCAGLDIYDARRVAESKGFAHYVLNYQDQFRQSVIDDFVESYLHGQTPIPCVRCNQTVKFRDLLRVAKDLNADCMATGHYVRRIFDSVAKKNRLHKALDVAKDQSYFLFATTQEQLDFLRFPLGGWDKSVTRDLAQRFDLPNAAKPDSQDICFVPDGDYAAVVRKAAPQAEREGDIIHLDGRVMGRHRGIIHYTVGQRKGLGIGGGYSEGNEPFYVVKIDPVDNRVFVGSREDLACSRVILKECNWLFDAHEGQSLPVEVKLRSMTKAVQADLVVREAGRAEINLQVPQYGVACGQAAVFYQDSLVLGGGWIEKTMRTSELSAPILTTSP